MVLMIRDTTGFSRVELQLRPAEFSKKKGENSNNHTAQAGGVNESVRQP